MAVQQLDKDLANSVRELEVEREKANASIGEQVRSPYLAGHVMQIYGNCMPQWTKESVAAVLMLMMPSSCLARVAG